jgi:hypothetical protein
MKMKNKLQTEDTCTEEEKEARKNFINLLEESGIIFTLFILLF